MPEHLKLRQTVKLQECESLDSFLPELPKISKLLDALASSIEGCNRDVCFLNLLIWCSVVQRLKAFFLWETNRELLYTSFYYLPLT